ncbi:heat shock protein 70 (HSP70)-interacting protein, putative [Ixodes scapularis]|uniref:Heat shock protein 70 (HSP70)-interacting protein, putative n=1 Tax=Ixodes scapularis TaxID=6945 RepID=B7Q0N5_IXOSC|nr:heat shock protein 70 (HSP70)-interacting protein, putative [Ixodes scapularis]|eukprot:XP_002408076.1 heat shock protein 70 (HSP70)-interacting protein, putative [Ixodes scapularis]
MESMEKEQLLQLQAFVELCRHKPEVLHKQELAFFKNYLERWGASWSNRMVSRKELDNTGVIEPDNEPPFENGDASIEVTDEMLEESSEKRSQAMELQNEGKLEESIKLWTEAILKNPSGAVLFAKRANVLLKLEKPNAAIRDHGLEDANRALELNPDQPLAYKIRGRANRLLGNWEEAAKDLAMACKLDYTDEANEWLKEVMPNYWSAIYMQELFTKNIETSTEDSRLHAFV